MWTIFEQEGIPVPDTLKRSLTEYPSQVGAARSQPKRMTIPPPDKPSMPKEASGDWFWLDKKEAALRTVVLALLNQGVSIPVKELIAQVKQILPDANEGSVSNLGTQLDDKVIQRTERGWSLKEGVKAPILCEDYIWAPKSLLQKQDLAAFRRMAVRYLLDTSHDGMQLMQIYRDLKEVKWLKTPLSKDLIKADLFVMRDEHRVRQKGTSKKWTVIKK